MAKKRITWTEEKIEEEILRIVKATGLKRMPSASEMELVAGDSALSNKIVKTGGFKFWANKLGLELKQSDTAKGWRYEGKALEDLKERGLLGEIMSTRHPFDILLEKSVKIEVKASSRYHPNGEEFFFHTFNLGRKYHSFDILMAYCLDEKEEVEKLLIIPARDIMSIRQLSVGEKSEYDKYDGDWESMMRYVNFYQEIS